MRTVLPLLLITVSSAIAQRSQIPVIPQKVTRLQIIESAPFRMDKEYLITSDSVIIDFKTIEGHALYSRALTNSEREDLLSPFNKIYLSGIRSSYKPKTINIADAASFNITLVKGKSIKATTVYCVKWEPFYTFSKKLDKLLPSGFKISYTTAYFHK